MGLKHQRNSELAKYEAAYEAPGYKMKKARMHDAITDLTNLPTRGAYLDVSCGNGEMMRAAKDLGFDPVKGTETVAKLLNADVVYALAHHLPFDHKSFDVVTMFDVIEHLIPGDDMLVCREMKRVARKHIILTANNKSSRNHRGDQLHINRRDYKEWDRLFREWFHPSTVTWIKGERAYISEAWRIDL